ncbi:MAG: class F sortase [Nocardioides sp.]|uniref:class F sortase n=1 Tax=Nocardioides sp. TaxID=35761 RepID=UPI003F0025A7
MRAGLAATTSSALLVIGLLGVPAATATADGPALERSGAAAAGQRVRIARISVDAPVKAVGLRDDGSLAVGGSATTVYRWKDGVVPGQRGSAVLAGHTWEAGDGVFDHLSSLRRGNVVRVGKHRFKVTRKQRVRSLSDEQIAALYADTGRPRIVLITCGDRDDAGTYHSRILVRARKIRG